MRKLALVVSALLLAACSDSTGPSSGLDPGTYRVSFTIPFSMDTPGGLFGDHEFTFRVSDPTDASSFDLLSSTYTARTRQDDPGEPSHDYLDPDTRDIIARTDQWRVQWSHARIATLAVRVTIATENGRLRLPFGCLGIRYETEQYPGVSCRVERVD